MDGFRLLIEAAKKKKKGIDTTKASHPRIGFPGYAYSSVPGDRNQTAMFKPSLGPGPAMPSPTHIDQQGDDGDGHSGVIVMGNGGGGAGGGSVAPVTALTGGAGDGGGAAAAGESVEARQIDAIIESFHQANPSSDVMDEIQKVFNGIKEGNGYLYHSCDGVSALTPNGEVPPTSEAQVSALAASCEAALNAFKEYTGFDYLSWRNQ